MPFCSDRCRLIDLGRWFDEDYSMPAELSDELDDDGYEGYGGSVDDPGNGEL